MSNTNQTNPFSTLGLKASFDLDPTAIERAYLRALTLAHPDSGGFGASEEAHGPDAAALNQARTTLLDGEQRAGVVLDLLGGPSAAQCKELPDGFLMEMMIRREEIEEQIAEGGNESRVSWEEWARDERAAYTTNAQALFDELEQASTTEKLTQTRVLLNAWRYIERLIEQLDPDYDPARADFR